MTQETYYIHDTETDSLVGGIIETAHIEVTPSKVGFIQELCNSGIQIEPGATETHGYTQYDVEGKKDFSSTKSYKILKEASQSGAWYVAHNAFFDLEKLRDHGIVWREDRIIDTLKVAQVLLKKSYMKSFKLQVLRFALDLDRHPDWETKMAKLGLTEIVPHTALSDVFVLWFFLDWLKETFNLTDQDLNRITYEPNLVETIEFGKEFEHGTKIPDMLYTVYNKRGSMGYEYLDWALGNMDMVKSDADKEGSFVKYLAEGIVEGKIKKLQHNNTRRVVMQAMAISLKGEHFKMAKEYLRYKNPENLIKKSIKKIQGDVEDMLKTRASLLEEMKGIKVDFKNLFPNKQEQEVIDRKQEITKTLEKLSKDIKKFNFQSGRLAVRLEKLLTTGEL